MTAWGALGGLNPTGALTTLSWSRPLGLPQPLLLAYKVPAWVSLGHLWESGVCRRHPSFLQWLKML